MNGRLRDLTSMASDPKTEWLVRVLGADLNSETTADEQMADADGLKARLLMVREDAQRLGLLPDLVAPLRDAVEALAAGSGSASALIDALEQRIATASRERRNAEVSQAISSAQTASGMGVVEFNKARLGLNAARASFEDAIDNLKASFQALLDTDDFVEDPRSTDPATLAAIDALEQSLPSFPSLADAVDDAIDRMVNASDAQQRQQLGAAALQEIEAFKHKLDADPRLREMESTDAGYFPIHTTMVAALDKVSAALRG